MRDAHINGEANEEMDSAAIALAEDEDILPEDGEAAGNEFEDF